MTGPRFAIWGTFDVDNYGDHLFPRVTARELRRRLPDARIDAFAPFGSAHPTRFDRMPVGALGRPTARRRAWFARSYDCVLAGGGELIHLNDRLLAPVYGVSPDRMADLAPTEWFVEGLGPALEERCPMVWHGLGVPPLTAPDGASRLATALRARRYVTVRDEGSRRRLVDAGVRAPITVVPDLALLVDRLVAAEDLDRRIGKLRTAGAFPEGPALVLQGCDLMVPHVGGVARAVSSILATDRHLTPVAMETGVCRGDAAFADALAARIPGLLRVPRSVTLDDVVAVLARASVFIGSSLHGAITAVAFGRPFVLLNMHGEAKLDAFGETTRLSDLVVRDAVAIESAFARARAGPLSTSAVRSLQARVDGHFDTVASLAAEGVRNGRGRAFVRVGRVWHGTARPTEGSPAH